MNSYNIFTQCENKVLIQQIIAVKRNNKEKWFIQNMTIKSVFRNKKVMTAFVWKVLSVDWVKLCRLLIVLTYLQQFVCYVRKKFVLSPKNVILKYSNIHTWIYFHNLLCKSICSILLCLRGIKWRKKNNMQSFKHILFLYILVQNLSS